METEVYVRERGLSHAKSFRNLHSVFCAGYRSMFSDRPVCFQERQPIQQHQAQMCLQTTSISSWFPNMSWGVSHEQCLHLLVAVLLFLVFVRNTSLALRSVPSKFQFLQPFFQEANQLAVSSGGTAVLCWSLLGPLAKYSTLVNRVIKSQEVIFALGYNKQLLI